VDSYFTILKRLEEITTLILVHGFDVPLDQVELREKIAQRIRQAAAELGKPLIEVETNLRAMSDPYACWPTHEFGAALASVAQLLAPQFHRVYIPASLSYRDLGPCGSHPLIDPLWSTEEVEVVLDGAESHRLLKVEKIAANETVLKSLRVCWENPAGEYNCGRCEKCLRTMIELRLHGALERCTAFDNPLDMRWVARMDVQNVYHRIFVVENLKAAREAGKDSELIRALQDALDEKYYRGFWKAGKWVMVKVPALRRIYRKMKGIEEQA